MARRKRKKRSNIQFKLFCLLSLLVAGIIAAFSMSFTHGFNATVFLIAFFASLVTFLILSIVFSLPSVKENSESEKFQKN